MPRGFDDVEEAQLHNAHRLLERESHGEALKSWWLAVPTPNSKTPNWDIASACEISGRRGLLLIEAKAHDVELRSEEKGKPLTSGREGSVSINARRNHVRIGACIQDASLALAGETGLPWALSRDWNYQMANRFTWAWKLASLGFPMILVYLGFLDCDEMAKKEQKAFCSDDEWRSLVLAHSAALVPPDVWNNPWKVHGQPFVPLIRSIQQSLDKLT